MVYPGVLLWATEKKTDCAHIGHIGYKALNTLRLGLVSKVCIGIFVFGNFAALFNCVIASMQGNWYAALGWFTAFFYAFYALAILESIRGAHRTLL